MRFTASSSFTYKWQGLPAIVVFCLVWICPKMSLAQNYYMQANNQLQYLTQDFNCDSCTLNSLIEGIPLGYGGLSFGPDGFLYILSGAPENTIHKVDINTFDVTLVYSDPYNVVQMGGFMAMGGGIFYSIANFQEPNDSLFIWDTNADTMYAVGELPYNPFGEMWMANGKVYYLSWQNGPRRIVEVDLNFPEESEIALEFTPDYVIYALTATPVANLMMGIETSYFSPGRHLVSLNMIDGTITKYCRMPKASTHGQLRTVTSLYEHAEVPSHLQIDLDCDDSSGATGDNFNSISVNCFSEDGAPVTDDDINIFIDARIATMTITVENPLDDPDEVFTVTGPLNGIQIDGDGTGTLTLINEGEAKISDYMDALKLVRYHNLNLSPTGGLRNIEVFFETESGNTCETAIAFIYVEEKDQIELDLGPDVMELCEGSTIILDPGLSQVEYLWSTGETSSSIEVTEGGTYSLTVSGGIDCPNSDEVEIIALPQYVITVDGDSVLCPGEEITLVINTDAPFEIDFELSVDPGSSTWYYGIESGYVINDSPSVPSDYFISSIIPSEPGCFDVNNAYQTISISPGLSFSDSVSICEGDSILLGPTWQHLPGDYSVIHPAAQGCDTLYTHTLTVSPLPQKFVEEITCDSSLAGVSVSWLMNANGCDTMQTKTINWVSPDTMIIQQTTCNQSSAGIFFDTLSNQYGCDSLVITNLAWTPPSDTTHLASSSCDPSQIGSFASYFLSASGCDSLVILNVSQGNADTTYSFTTSCDPSSLGVFITSFTNAQSCDSTIITTVTFSERDSVFLSDASCNPADVGIEITTYINQFGCDSVVTLTTSLLPVDQVFIQSTTCDPSAAGDFITTLVNQHGCDSIIHETVELLPQQHIALSSTTCISTEAGVFVSSFVNQFGCDSIITETVSFIPADSTFQLQYTCDPAEVSYTETIYTSQDGCDSLVISGVDLFPLPDVEIQSANDYSGYQIRCAGAHDGFISPLIFGVPPYSYVWSNGSTELFLQDIPAGIYQLTVTDANGCIGSDVITMTQPPPLSFTLEITQPGCTELQPGAISVLANGGVPSYAYSINEETPQASPVFNSLGEGLYLVEVNDGNDCHITETVSLITPISIDVDLGEDRFISLGDSIRIEAIVNMPMDSITSLTWTGFDQTICPGCLTQVLSPLVNTVYTLSVISMDGCTDQDSMTVFVHSDSKEENYIPNVFSPNGDNQNDSFILYLSENVEEVSAFSIFDRWGTLLFGVETVHPSDPSLAWDGKMDGQTMNPGVFTYKLILKMKNGETKVQYGDITLIR